MNTSKNCAHVETIFVYDSLKKPKIDINSLGVSSYMVNLCLERILEFQIGYRNFEKCQ